MKTLTVNQLRDLMEFDHVIEVHEDGGVTDAPGDVWAPEVYDDKVEQEGGWRLLTGWSAQYEYSGPAMHSSEFIGGALAEAILSEPGYYAAVVIYDDRGLDAESWAIAYRPAS
jgi:hypothetical protein